MQIHFTFAFCLMVWDLCVRPTLWVVTLTVLLSALVMSAELANTGMERVVDLAAGGKEHELAKRAKDVSAGAVLTVCVGAVAGAWYVLWITPWHWYLWTLRRWPGALLSAVTLVCLCAVAIWTVLRRNSYR